MKVSYYIEEVKEADQIEWEKYLHSRSYTTISDCWVWRKIVEKSYNLPHYWFAAKNDGKIKGVLALTLTKNPIFGKYLATAPFCTHGGFYFETKKASLMHEQGLICIIKSNTLTNRCYSI